MIQRIQSVFLLAASLLFFFLLYYPIAEIVTAEQELIVMNFLRFEAVNPSAGFESFDILPLTILLFTIMLLGIITIFLYKKRTMQMRFCMFNILLMFGLVGLIYYYSKIAPMGVEREESIILWPVVVPFISAILTFLAMKAIQKDDALIKSLDRLR
jgi:hypothetical protein